VQPSFYKTAWDIPCSQCEYLTHFSTILTHYICHLTSFLTQKKENRRQIWVFYFASSYNKSTKQLSQAERISLDRWKEENELHRFSKNNFPFLLHRTLHSEQNNSSAARDLLKHSVWRNCGIQNTLTSNSEQISSSGETCWLLFGTYNARNSSINPTPTILLRYFDSLVQCSERLSLSRVVDCCLLGCVAVQFCVCLKITVFWVVAPRSLVKFTSV
jgi:hypothetical protein